MCFTLLWGEPGKQPGTGGLLPLPATQLARERARERERERVAEWNFALLAHLKLKNLIFGRKAAGAPHRDRARFCSVGANGWNSFSETPWFYGVDCLEAALSACMRSALHTARLKTVPVAKARFE